METLEAKTGSLAGKEWAEVSDTSITARGALCQRAVALGPEASGGPSPVLILCNLL